MSLLRLTRKRIVALVSAVLIPGSVYAASQAGIGPFKKVLQVETAQVERGTISQTVTATGEIVAETKVNVKFQTSGRLAWVGVQKGDRVKKWQAIASLDKRELEKRLKKDLNAYLRERTEFDDDQDTYPGGPWTDEIVRILKRSQIDLDQTVLDVEIRDLTLKYATIYSPIDGIVTKIDTPVAGVNITPATAVFTIADPSSLTFEARVDETDIRLIKEGQEVTINLDALPDQKLKGRVVEIAFTSQTTRGGGTVFPVKVSLPSPENFSYRIGMNGDAEFRITTREDALTIPLEALLPDNLVWVKRGQRYEKVKVEVGIENDAHLEITSGLNEGDLVVIGGFENLSV